MQIDQPREPCVVEQAILTVIPGANEGFEAAMARGLKFLSEAVGFQWAQVLHRIEDPQVWVLLVGWDTLESHTRDFVDSVLFAQWRAEIGPFLAGGAEIAHHVLGAAVAPGRSSDA